MAELLLAQEVYKIVGAAVEINVMEQLTSREEAQLLNYLAVTRMKVGVLINFGDPGRLDWKRFVL